MKEKTVFFCTECGNETAKWQGRCPACGAWNTIIERPSEPVSAKGKTRTAGAVGTLEGRKPKPIREVQAGQEVRFGTGLKELDRVLGGGAVVGSLVLVSGAPGIGKSTLLLQICTSLCRDRKVLYVSGEESESQIKLRADRLGVDPESLYLLSETAMDQVMDCVESLAPEVLIVDSVQTLYQSQVSSAPGSVAQVKGCTMQLMQLAKSREVTVFIVGHVNKEGAIAGPKVLEHMVDTVLYFEGDRSSAYRILRAEKNRFGSTNEIGVFEMSDAGLSQVDNPSELLLSGRPKGAPGTCVACVMEGSRPVLAELQALVVSSSFNVPRRTADGMDYNRAVLLMAVMEKRGGVSLGGCDGYINVIGGLTVNEPAADLPMVLAVASSRAETPIPDDMAAVGEVGLTGEIRAVTYLAQRLAELNRLGFTRCLIPRQGTAKLAAPQGMELIRVGDIRQAIAKALSSR